MAILKYVAMFILGGAAGAAGGWIFASKKKEKWCTKQIEEMRAYYEKKASGEAKEEETDFTEVPKEEEKKEPPEEYTAQPMHAEDSLTRGKKTKKEEVPRHDYTQHYRGGSEVVRDDDYDENYSLGRNASEENQALRPYQITEMEFGKDASYKTMTLNYYMYNGALTIEDEQNEELISDFQDVERLIGDTISEYGFDNNDEDTLYIRNERMGTEYMIMKRFCKYVDG